MSTGRILIVAPDPDLRKSLAFALKAEGYAVTSQAFLAEPAEGRDYDCVVLDHKATKLAEREAVLDFCAAAHRVVLLAGLPQPWLLTKVFSVVETPHLGAALTSAVEVAMRSRPPTAAGQPDTGSGLADPTETKPNA